MSRFNAEMIYFVCDTKTNYGKTLCETILAEAKSIHGKDFGPTLITRREDGIIDLFSKLDVNSIGSVPIELETSFVSDNQWNSKEFGRVMDFITLVYPRGNRNRNIVQGYFLDFSLELADLRTKKRCCYCGKTMEDSNDPNFFENWHLSCTIEHMTKDNIDLSYSTPIWKGGFNKKNLPKEIPQLILDNYKNRKISSMTEKAIKMSEGRTESYKEYSRKHDKKTAILSWVVKFCWEVATHLDIFIYANDPIIYTHKNPIEICFNWCLYGYDTINETQFNSIISYMKNNYGMDDKNIFRIGSEEIIFTLGK